MTLSITHTFVSAKADSTDATLINPSNWNAGHTISNPYGILVCLDYSFTPQPLSGSLGSLIIGSNTITLTPVPLGVNGTDTAHYLYISGGTGTAEAVLITGGTAVSGATTGTVIITCANTHSGAWKVSSATSGIQEALVVGTSVCIPRGSWPIYAPSNISRGSSIWGDGPDTSTVSLQGEIVGFNVNTAQVVSFRDFTIVSVVSSPTTATGIVLDAPSSGSTTSFITRMRFFNLAIGLDMPNGGVDSITDNYFLQMTVYGIRKQSIHTADNGGGRIINNIITNFDVTMGTAAIYHTSGGATLISGNNIFGFQYGYYLNANVASGTSELQIYDNIMDDCQIAAIFITGAQPYYLIQICNNKLTNFLPLLLTWIGIHTTNVGNLHDNGCISGNLINGQNASNVGIQIDSGNTWAISNNNLTSLATGIHIGAGSASVVSQQVMVSVTTPLEIASSTATCILPTALTFAQLTAVGFVPAYGSVIYCSNGTIANPVAGGGTGCIAKYLNGVWIGN